MSVASIAQRLSLRAPQRASLETLERLAGALALPVTGQPERAYFAVKDGDRATQLAACRAAAPSLTSFDRAFPSFTFALATGVGKTRLMGASIAYLNQVHGIRDFFVVAPNLTIYEKLRADFTPNTPKYVFEGLAEFAATPPLLVDADNWESGVGVRPERFELFGPGEVHINLFNISLFASEEGRKMRRLREYIGEPYFDYLAGLPALALLMDESHRYRAATSAQALNDLRPLIGLEFTATPQVQHGQRTTPFTNVAYEYKLAQAIRDGFVKRPAVAGRANFDTSGIAEDQLERIKLEDALVLHEKTKAELAAYAAREDVALVKPFVLVIARDTVHASALQALIESAAFHGGIYAGRVITVHSNRTGAERDEVVRRLLRVEHAEEPTEIVIHVEMLKEGWDVTNLYTIVPLRAAQSRTLVEQSIGRGLRLPYGRTTGVPEVDRLTIVAHDRFQEIVDDAERDDSPFRLEQVIIDPDDPASRIVPIRVAPTIDGRLAAPAPSIEGAPAPAVAPLFAKPAEQAVAHATGLALSDFRALPSLGLLARPEPRAALVNAVRERLSGTEQLAFGPALGEADVIRVVEATVEEVARRTIEVPRIMLVPTGETVVSYRPFTLDTSAMRYAAPSEEILVAELQSRERERIAAGLVPTEQRPEDYIVRALIDESDIPYDECATLLYELAAQAVKAVGKYAADSALHAIMATYGRDIAAKIATQLRANRVERPASYNPVVREGWMRLHDINGTAIAGEAVRPFRTPVTDRYRIRQMQFGGFSDRALFRVQRFDSDAERRFAVLLEDDPDRTLKWFRPGRQDIHLFWNGEQQYVPDFIVETAGEKLLVEVKSEDEVDDTEVQAKGRAAVEWCSHASAHAATFGGKGWRYVLVPDVAITASADLTGLVARFGVTASA